MSTRSAAPRLAAVLVLLALGLSACGDRDEPVADAAEAFYAAVAASDGQTACELLAPATRSELQQSAQLPCAQAILEEGLPDVHEPLEVEVYGTAGVVRYAAETAFLGRFDEGWRVVAAVCSPQSGDVPHDCKVTGG